jgi:hypothetical protein
MRTLAVAPGFFRFSATRWAVTLDGAMKPMVTSSPNLHSRPLGWHPRQKASELVIYGGYTGALKEPATGQIV